MKSIAIEGNMSEYHVSMHNELVRLDPAWDMRSENVVSMEQCIAQWYDD